MDDLNFAGINVKVSWTPVEIPRPVPFKLDESHASYDSEYAHRFWRILATVTPVFQKFRAGFIGKASPVHFFWGSFDLAATRFSGRRAPARPGAAIFLKEGSSHALFSRVFFPG